MARIEGVTDEKAGLVSRGLFWLARRKLGRVSEMWRIAAHAPRIQLGRGLLELLLDSSKLVDRRLRWLGVIKTAMLVGCPAWLDADAALGRAAGITDEQLADLSRYRESSLFSPVEKLVLDLAVGMAATPAVVSDELFAQLRRHFSDAQLVELVSDIAMGNMRSRFNRAFLCRPAGFSEGTYCPLPETWWRRAWGLIPSASARWSVLLLEGPVVRLAYHRAGIPNRIEAWLDFMRGLRNSLSDA